MNSQELLYLSRSAIENLEIPMARVIDAVEKMFVEKGAGGVELPPKPAIHFKGEAFINAMPAAISSMGSAGVKWVSTFPQNRQGGLPTITGLLILNDVETGLPIAVMDCTWITAKRTGAATAVAARHLANPESSKVAIIACGIQGRSNLEALSCVFDISQVKVYDIAQEGARHYAKEMGNKLGLSIEVVATPKDAMAGSDLVVTSGPISKHPRPAIQAGWLQPGAFASAVDYDSYWCPSALRELDKFFTDDIAQMGYYRTLGYFEHTPQPTGDLGELLTGKVQGRENAQQRILTMNLGLASADMAMAPLIYEKAVKHNIGTLLPL